VGVVVSDTVPKIRISGLTRLEQLELADAMPSGQVVPQLEKTLVGGQHGDLATWQVVIDAYGPALPLLAAWLLKRRKKTVVEIEVESDGAGWEQRSVRIETSEQSAPEAGVLGQLRELMRASEVPSAGSGGLL
jgi:hypothetical protein